MTRPFRVLVVDDETFVRESLREVLAAEGFTVDGANDVKSARARLAKYAYDAVVTDLRMPGESGLALFDETLSNSPLTPILVITGVGTVSDAVAAMKKGAFDFLQKPIDPDELVRRVRRAAEHKRLSTEVRSLRADDAGQESALLGGSAAIERVRASIAQAGTSDAPVLVTGEPGVGKVLVARAVHAASPRARAPFVRLACDRVTEETFETEWLGTRRAKGASRPGKLEEAEGGTLVLETVDALKIPLQRRLLSVLADGEYERGGEMRALDVRWISITQVDLAARARAGAFLSDLYYRLGSFPIHVPPLAARKDDVVAIAAHLLSHARARHATTRATVGPEALDVLLSYDWPGNVRELENVIERAATLAAGREITADVLRTIVEAGVPTRQKNDLREFNIRGNLDAREKELILGALERTRGKKREASDLLGIDARNLGYYLRKHKIQDFPASSDDGG